MGGERHHIALGEFRLAADRRNGSLYTIVEMATRVESAVGEREREGEGMRDGRTGERADGTKKGENKQKPGKRQSVRPSVRPLRGRGGKSISIGELD